MRRHSKGSLRDGGGIKEEAGDKKRLHRYQRRHTGMPKLNRAQQKFKHERLREEKILKVDPKQRERDDLSNTANVEAHSQSDENHSDIDMSTSTREKQADSAHPFQQQKRHHGGVYLSAYKRAQQTFERLHADKRAQQQQKREERERQLAEQQFNTRWRRKKNQTLLLRTQKGQPNLNAQIGVLLEKIERKTEEPTGPK